MADLTSRLFEQLCNAYGTEVVTTLLRTAFNLKPGLEKDWRRMRSTRDVEGVVARVVGAIDVSAATGAIGVDVRLVQTLRGIRFDHDKGFALIGKLRFTAQLSVISSSPFAAKRSPEPMLGKRPEGLSAEHRFMLGHEKPLIEKHVRIERQRKVRLD